MCHQCAHVQYIRAFHKARSRLGAYLAATVKVGLPAVRAGVRDGTQVTGQ